MIKQIKIKNFAIVKELTLNFNSGFNVFIGETGSGKSIIFNALSFVLGGKSNKNQIRTNEKEMRVEAVFDNYNNNVKSILEDMGQADEEIIILSRKLDAEGKTECKINGSIVTLSMLRKLAEKLIDFYGQHENQVLLKTSNHIDILDSYKPELLKDLKQQISGLMHQFKDIKNEITNLGGSNENRERMLDLLNYQIAEIEDINPKVGEFEEIETRLDEIRNSEKIVSSLKVAFENLDSSNSATIYLKDAIRALTNISNFNNKFENYQERLNSVLYEIQDVVDSLKSDFNNYNYSEIELEALDQRLDSLKKIKRKYGKTIEDVLNFLENSKNEQSKLQNVDKEIEHLNSELNNITLKLREKSIELSNIRKNLAIELESQIMGQLSLIGMKNAKLKIDFATPKSENEEIFTNNGIDNVEFLFSANLGETLKPIVKTISGGEMSRFMLALKNIIASTDGVETLVFDEIDSGISGEIGSAIAERIAYLSKRFQILCITHLPQVTVMGDNYFYVYKVSDSNSTQTKIDILDESTLYPIIAKLSGNKFKTEIALAHAKELKNWANKYKQTI